MLKGGDTLCQKYIVTITAIYRSIQTSMPVRLMRILMSICTATSTSILIQMRTAMFIHILTLIQTDSMSTITDIFILLNIQKRYLTVCPAS